MSIHHCSKCSQSFEAFLSLSASSWYVLSLPSKTSIPTSQSPPTCTVITLTTSTTTTTHRANTHVHPAAPPPQSLTSDPAARSQ